MNLKPDNLTHDDEMPYEKCMKYGPEALTDAELLAVLLRTGHGGVAAGTGSQPAV